LTTTEADNADKSELTTIVAKMNNRGPIQAQQRAGRKRLAGKRRNNQGGDTGGNTKDEIVVDVPPARRQRTNQGLSPDPLALASSPAAAAAARSAAVARGKGRGRGAGRQGGRGGRRGRH
jgi:hypothetical protein